MHKSSPSIITRKMEADIQTVGFAAFCAKQRAKQRGSGLAIDHFYSIQDLTLGVPSGFRIWVSPRH